MSFGSWLEIEYESGQFVNNSHIACSWRLEDTRSKYVFHIECIVEKIIFCHLLLGGSPDASA